MKSSHLRKGFTLVEMLIVIAIIAILASIALVSVGGVRQSARDTKRVSDISKIQQQLEVYYSINGKYPTDIDFNSLANVNFNDPTGEPYSYGVYGGNDQKYVVGITMEGGSSAMNESNEIEVNPTSSGIDCDDAVLGYCVGN